MDIDYYQGCHDVNDFGCLTWNNLGFSFPLMETLKDRINERMATLDLTQDQVAKLAGISQTSVYKLTSGKAKQTRKIVQLAQALQCRAEWLEDGTEPMEGYLSGAMREHFAQAANVEAAPDIVGKVPLISWVQAGVFCSAPDLLQPGDAEEWIPTPKKYGPHAYALRVVGDSMVSPNPAQASYHPGILIIVDPDRAITNGSRVVARINGTEEATFKVYAEDAGKRYLRPLNPQYPTITMTEDMMICGVVVGSWRDE